MNSPQQQPGNDNTPQDIETFNDLEDIARIIDEVNPELVREDKNDLKTPQGLYRCTPVSDRYHLEPNATDDQALRNADTICLGGIYQLSNKLGQLVKAKVGLLTQEEQTAVEKVNAPSAKLPANYENTLVYHSTVSKIRRFKDVYEWNSNKAFASREMRDLGERIWKTRFTDGRGKLLKSHEIDPLLIFTYSFGARMAEMLENVWQEKLAENGVTQPDEVQAYLNRFRRVSIASAPDVSDFSKLPEKDSDGDYIAVEMEDRPRIMTLNYISIDDKVPKHTKHFSKVFYKFVNNNNAPMVRLDVWPNMDIKIFNRSVVIDTNQYGHSFTSYVRAIKGHDLPGLQKFVGEIFLPPLQGLGRK